MNKHIYNRIKKLNKITNKIKRNKYLLSYFRGKRDSIQSSLAIGTSSNNSTIMTTQNERTFTNETSINEDPSWRASCRLNQCFNEVLDEINQKCSTTSDLDCLHDECSAMFDEIEDETLKNSFMNSVKSVNRKNERLFNNRVRMKKEGNLKLKMRKGNTEKLAEKE